MKTLAVNQNNDIFTVNGVLVLANDIDAVMQQCARAVKAQVNEMPYSFNRGTNYKEYIFNGHPQWNSFVTNIRNQISNVENVIEIP